MKFLFSLTFILIIILAGLLIVPSFIDWSQYKDQIRAQVEKATGYNLEINGELRAAFLPTPHVNLNDMSIDSGSADGPFAFDAQVEKASVSIALMPLLSGNIAVSDVTLINPIVDLREQNPSKTADQERLEQLTSTEPQKEKAAPNIQLDNVYLEGAQISYKPLNGEVMTIGFPKFQLSADSLKGPFAFDGRIVYAAFDLNMNGNVGEMVDDAPITISLSIDDKAYDLKYNGIVDLTKDIPQIQGEMALSAPSLKNLAQQFGANELNVKDQSMALTGLVNGTAKAVKLDNGQLTLGNTNKMPVNFAYDIDKKSGRVALQNIPGGGMIDLDIAQTDNATSLSGQVMIESLKAIAYDTLGLVESQLFDNPNMPNNVSGDINASLGDVIGLKSKSLTVGSYKISGTDVRYITGDEPKIQASINSFEGAKIQANGTLNMEEGVDISVSHPNAAKFIQVFNKEFEATATTQKPFAFSGLVLKNGDVIQANNMTAKIGDISTNGSIVVNMATSVPTVKADLNFDRLDTRALISGKKSSATANNPTGGKSSSAVKSTSAPWARDAIDTSPLRAINLDLTAKAKSLVHGTWLISNPSIDIDLNQGVLDINAIKGGLFDGTVDISGQVSAKAEGQPISASGQINAANVDLSNLVKAALSQNKERVTGTGSFNLSLNTSGLSSSALIYALNGDGNITTSDLVVKGIDLAKITEAISDESLTDLATVVQGAFKSGQTPFEPINHDIAIREGTMPINNFTLVSPTANIVSNGSVSFSNWMMNVKNTVDFTNPDDLPNVEMTIKGPLNAPQQSIANDVLISFIKNKYGAKIQNKINELIGDKLGDDNPAGAIINNLLGLPQQQPTQQAPAANDNVPEPQAEQEQPQEQPKIEEQLIRGLFDQLAR